MAFVVECGDFSSGSRWDGILDKRYWPSQVVPSAYNAGRPPKRAELCISNRPTTPRAAIDPNAASEPGSSGPQRTALINFLRTTRRIGLIAPQGVWQIPQLHAPAKAASSSVLPDAVRGCAELIMGQIEDLQSRIDNLNPQAERALAHGPSNVQFHFTPTSAS